MITTSPAALGNSVRARPVLGYLIALGLAVLATILRRMLTPWVGPFELPFITYFPAAFVAAWLLGLRPALLTVGLSALCVDYFFLAPTGEFSPKTPVALVGLAVFLAVGAGAALLGEREYQARLAAEAQARENDRLRQLAEDSASQAEEEAARAEEETLRADELAADHRRGEETLGFLSEASAALGASLDYEATLATVARLAVPALADWCAVDLAEADGTLRRIALSHADPTKERWAWDLERRFPARPDDGDGVYGILRSGRSSFQPVIAPAMFDRDTRPPEQVGLLRELGPTAYIGVPLAAHGNVFGVLSFLMSDSGRHYTDGDLRLAETLGQRAGVAVDNARRHGQCVESANMLDAVLGASPVGQAFVDRELRYVHVNPTLAALHGVPVEAHVNRPIRDVLPAWADVLEPLHRQVFETGVPVLDHEVTLPAPGGGYHQLVVSCFPVRDAAGETRWVGVTKADVTERRRMEEQVQAAQRLESVGRLAGGVAHEINNALQGVVGFNAFMLQRLPHDHPLRRDAEYVQQSAERAAGITQQLLAYSRRQVLQQVDLDFAQVVAEFTPILRQALGPDRQLVLETGGGRAMVHADRAQLEQALLNLTLNARDAMPSEGRLTIRLDRLPDRSIGVRTGVPLEPGQYVQLTVHDSGIGMDESTRARAFEPFFTTKPIGQGTGLGLSVVHGIVQQSGGQVWVESTPGQGTAIRVVLPEAADRTGSDTGDNRRAAPRPAGMPAGGPERVLVVDDEPVVLAFAVSMLRDAGYEVLEAGQGDEALAVFASTRAAGQEVDLVLTDLVMPSRGGRALGDALAQLAPELPVIYTSGYTGDEVSRRGLLSEGADFLPKPFSPEELLRRIRARLDR